MSTRSITDARVLITGASSGIGRELARALLRQGADLVVTARREERLRGLADEFRATGRQVVCVPGDITDAAVRERLVRAAQEMLGGLDILVNNAGVGAVGQFSRAGGAVTTHHGSELLCAGGVDSHRAAVVAPPAAGR